MKLVLCYARSTKYTLYEHRFRSVANKKPRLKYNDSPDIYLFLKHNQILDAWYRKIRTVSSSKDLKKWYSPKSEFQWSAKTTRTGGKAPWIADEGCSQRLMFVRSIGAKTVRQISNFTLYIIKITALVNFNIESSFQSWYIVESIIVTI